MDPKSLTILAVGPKGLRYIRLVSIGWSFFLCLVIGILFWGNVNSVNGKALSDTTSEIINVSIAGGVFLIATVTRLANINKLYKNLMFILNSETIEQYKDEMPQFGFDYHNITGIVRTYRGSFIIYNSDGKRMIVPHFIGNRDEFETLIRSRFPNIVAGPYSFLEKYHIAMIYLAIALSMAVLIVSNKIMLPICCALLVALFTIYAVNRYRLAKRSGQAGIKLILLPTGATFLALVITIIKLLK